MIRALTQDLALFLSHLALLNTCYGYDSGLGNE